MRNPSGLSDFLKIQSYFIHGTPAGHCLPSNWNIGCDNPVWFSPGLPSDILPKGTNLLLRSEYETKEDIPFLLFVAEHKNLD
jgi:hypothetical protein